MYIAGMRTLADPDGEDVLPCISIDEVSVHLQEKYWHCYGHLEGATGDNYFVVNDLSFAELRRRIAVPYVEGSRFSVAGTIIKSRDSLGAIRIAWTKDTAAAYARRYDASLPRNVADMGTDRRLLVFDEGEDYTHELLFAEAARVAVAPDEALILSVCRRIAYSAKILAHRNRQKASYIISDEYDVQDLLHATLRAIIKSSVQENPIGKVAGAKAGRADISIEDLGVLIEAKFVRGPKDQKRILHEFSEDLVLYSKWKPLKTLIFLVYNSGDLRDPEALLELEGKKEVMGCRFTTKVVLS